MEDKKSLLEDIKKIWSSQNIKDFDITPELLNYLELEDLQKLKAKILNSFSNLSNEQKEWLAKFRKE